MNNESDITDLEHHLMVERPVPSAAFRGELGRQLAESHEGRSVTARTRITVATCAGSGTFLMAVAAIGVLGVGPLAS